LVEQLSAKQPVKGSNPFHVSRYRRVREWLMRFAWKANRGCKVSRGFESLLFCQIERFKMTSEVKEILGKSIVNDEQIIDDLFKSTLKSIFDAQDEETLILFSSQLSEKIEQYRK
jgi:hypothetical protein